MSDEAVRDSVADDAPDAPEPVTSDRDAPGDAVHADGPSDDGSRSRATAPPPRPQASTPPGETPNGTDADDVPDGLGSTSYSVWVDDIVSEVPSWPVRRGAATMLIVVLVALATAWFVQYPDKISAPISLTTDQAPVRVSAPVSSRIEALFVGEKELVQKGDVLGVLENPAVYDDVQALIQWKESVDALLGDGASWAEVPEPPKGLEVGAIQEPYLSLMQALSDFRSFVKDPYREAKRTSLEGQLREYRQQVKTQERQEKLLQDELAIAREEVERRQRLYEDDYIPEAEYEQARSKVLQLRNRAEELEMAQATNRIRISEIESQLLDLDQRQTDQRRTLRLMVQKANESFASALNRWRQTYLLSAPQSGVVSFSEIVQEGQYVTASQSLLAIVPESGDVYGRLMLPASNVGGVEVGQEVRIATQRPPASKVGKINGQVEDISLVAGEESYLVRVALPKGLTTEFGHDLDFRQEMPANADVITDRRRLLVRVFDWLRYLISDNTGA